MARPRGPRERLPKGWLYNLTPNTAQFRATGLDAAYRISKRVEEAVQAALATDPEVIAVVKAPTLEADADASNFKPSAASAE